MKVLYLFFLILLTVSGCTQSNKSISGNRQDLSAPEVKTALATKKETVILDVRTPEEFAAGHLAGAQNLNYYHPDFAKQLDQLDKAKTYLIYCASGNRSGKTATLMQDKGFKKIMNATAGFAELKQAELPVK